MCEGGEGRGQARVRSRCRGRVGAADKGRSSQRFSSGSTLGSTDIYKCTQPPYGWGAPNIHKLLSACHPPPLSPPASHPPPPSPPINPHLHHRPQHATHLHHPTSTIPPSTPPTSSPPSACHPPPSSHLITKVAFWSLPFETTVQGRHSHAPSGRNHLDLALAVGPLVAYGTGGVA